MTLQPVPLSLGYKYTLTLTRVQIGLHGPRKKREDYICLYTLTLTLTRVQIGIIQVLLQLKFWLKCLANVSPP